VYRDFLSFIEVKGILGPPPFKPAPAYAHGIIKRGQRRWNVKGIRMIEKSVKKLDLKRDSSIKEDLAYWFNKTPQERIAAIEFLRRQYHGSSARLQRSARVVQQTQG
jgi:hypothetical protein